MLKSNTILTGTTLSLPSDVRSIIPRRHAIQLTKVAIKKGNVVVAHGQRYFYNRHIASLQQSTGFLDADVVDVLKNRCARFYCKNSRKVAWSQTAETGQEG